MDDDMTPLTRQTVLLDAAEKAFPDNRQKVAWLYNDGYATGRRTPFDVAGESHGALLNVLADMKSDLNNFPSC